jgi:hypothetical protein
LYSIEGGLSFPELHYSWRIEILELFVVCLNQPANRQWCDSSKKKYIYTTPVRTSL